MAKINSNPSVLHVINELYTGGAQRALCNLLSGGLAESHNTKIVTLQSGGAIEQQVRNLGLSVEVLGIRRGVPLLSAAYKLAGLVHQWQPEIVQGWMYHGNLVASLAARLAPGNAALVWNVRHSLHSLQKEKAQTRQIIRLNRWLSGSADMILYNSKLSCTQHKQLGFADTRAQVIPNGFDPALLCPDAAARQRVRNELGLPAGTILIGHAARFHPMKDHAGFLRSSIMVARQQDNVHFVLAGTQVVRDNPLFQELIPDQLQHRFHFLGERKNMVEVMQALDIFCMSSAWGDAFPNVLGEAMASGVPCVTTDVGDSAYIVGDTGIIVPPDDKEQLLQGLLTLTGMPESTRHALGQQAREQILTHFTLQKVVNTYSDLYQSLQRRKN